jgi:hypothetical protein
LIEALPHFFQLTVACLQRGQEFAEHLLQQDRIVRKKGVGSRGA